MKEQWVMTLTSVQREGDEATESTLDTEISYYTDQNGDRVIEYEETEATGMEGSQMQLRYAPDGMVSKGDGNGSCSGALGDRCRRPDAA